LRFIIDTAAEASILWTKLDNYNLLPSKYKIFGLGNHNVKTLGCKNVKLKIDDKKFKVEMHVIRSNNLEFDGLLGIDFLRKYRGVINIGKNEITLNGHTTPLVSSYSQNQDYAEVRLLGKDVTQPPPTPRYTPLKTDTPLKISPGNAKINFFQVSHKQATDFRENLFVVEPLEINQPLDEKRIYIARTISQLIKKECNSKYCHKNCIQCKYFIPVQISNFNNTEITVIKGTLIARLIPVTQEDIMSADCLMAESNADDATRHVHNLNIDETNYEEKLEINEEMLKEKLKHLPHEYQEKFKKLILQDFYDIFIEKKIREGTRLAEHTIRLTEDKVVRTKPYKISLALQEYADLAIGAQLSSRTIRKSTSPYNSGIVLVRKKSSDGTISYRVTLDLRKINFLTEPEPYAFLNLHDSLSNLSKCKYFTTLDLKDSFYNIPLSEDSKKYTSFTVPSGKYAGTYEYNFMCQGLKNASSSMQRFLDGLLHNLSPLIVLCYIDDLCVFGNSLEENLARTRQVLERLQEGNVTVNLKKCQFAVESIIFLGYKIEKNSISADPRLIEKIVNFSIPEDIRDVMAWNGLSGYYRILIKNYAEINRPISDLLKNHKNNLKKKVHFTQECIDAFHKIKKIMTSSPVLVIPDPRKEFRLCVDTSGYASGAVLEQLGEDGLYHPCAYASRKLSPREQAESAAIREMIGFCWSLKHFKYYLYGQTHFTVVVDNAALKYLLTMKNPNSKLLRMALEISDYSFTVVHRAGLSHGNADAVSRFVNVVKVFDLDELQQHQQRDPECRILSTKPNFFKHDGILFFQSGRGARAVLPKSLRNIVLQQEHDSVLSAHCGKHTTHKKIAAQYYWPNRRREVDFYCMTCPSCAARRTTDTTNMKLQEMPQPREVFEFVGIDITQLPATGEYQYILTIVDFFSRFLVMVPMIDQTAATVAKAFVENFALVYNCPKYLYSDLGRQFESELFSEMCKLLDISKLRTTPRHPASNGKTEINHKNIKLMLSHYVHKNQKNWPKLLKYVVCVHNNKPHHSLNKYSPYEVVYGKKMRTPFSLIQDELPEINNEDVQELGEKLKKIWDEVYSYNHQSFLKYARAHDKKSREVEFKVGDIVWLHDDSVKKHESPKLAAKFKGPYPVTRILSPVNTEIQLPNRLVVVHNNRLKLYKKRANTAVSVSCSQDAASNGPQNDNNTDPQPSTSKQNTPPPRVTRDTSSAATAEQSDRDNDSVASEVQVPLRPGARATRGRTNQGFYSKFY
jgi:transposase InsO family protein